MAKSRDAFRTISEVSDWLNTPAHVLRFWESKFTQIKPVKRAGGRRYYRPQDMALLSGIKTLLHEQGMTIKGAQKLLRDKGIKHVASLGEDPKAASGTATRIKDVTPKAEAASQNADDPWPSDDLNADLPPVEPSAPPPVSAVSNVPDLPDDTHPDRSGALTLAVRADRTKLGKSAEALAPLVAQLKAAHERMVQNAA